MILTWASPREYSRGRGGPSAREPSLNPIIAGTGRRMELWRLGEQVPERVHPSTVQEEEVFEVYRTHHVRLRVGYGRERIGEQMG